MQKSVLIAFSSCLMVIASSTTKSLADDELKVASDIRVEPPSMTLTNRRRPHSIVVTGLTALGLSVDLGPEAAWTSSDEKIAKVDLLGWVEPVANGTAKITVSAAGKSATVDVSVKLGEDVKPYSFRHDVMPVLSKGGCNMGACHGYSLGKNGFKLSLRGSDPIPDYASLTDEFLERRINRHNPPASLLVTKPLGDVPHQGGVRFDHGTLMHQLLLGWVDEGATGDLEDPVKLESIRIYPENAVLKPGMQHQMQLIATYSDGTQRDVTQLGIFDANTKRVASVDADGLVNALELGETAIVARFERIFATANFIVLNPDAGFKPTPVPENLVDSHIIRKLNELKIHPSGLVDDVGYLRRVSLDLIGLQPTPDEVLDFLADKDPQKRTTIVDKLLARSEFVDRWTLKWGDLLQNSRNRLSEPAVYAFREWVRSAVAQNMPLDQFVREILTASGGVSDHPASAYFAVSKDTDDTLQRATQVFCGVRMLCAKCHPHPFENWTQGDYYGLHSFFNQVTTKADPRLPGVGNAKTVLVNLPAGYSTNPRTKKQQPPRFLGAEEPKIKTGIDRRVVYANWLTSAENPHFARSMTNRIWSYFFHRGIIDPVDDLRTTNPPINPELLDALTQDFVEHKFDVRHLMRRIVLSETYQRSGIPNATNGHDDLNFSRSIPRRISAEALLDSLVQATGVPENFPGAPSGFTATQLPDANVQSEFLNLFGKPRRMEACECERDDGANMLQALHFINGKSILSRVTNANSRANQLVNQKLGDDELIDKLYLWSLARHASADEIALGRKYFGAYEGTRNEAAQDLMWALLNSGDFMLVH